MAENEIRVGDVGTILELIVIVNKKVIDISNATRMEMVFKKPSGAVVRKTAIHSTDGKDGAARYKTEEGFLDEASDLASDDGNDWERQLDIDLEGWSGHSDIVTFRVYPNLD